jgi:hypothetical protein
MLVTIVVSGFQRVREPRPFESRKTDGTLAVDTRQTSEEESGFQFIEGSEFLEAGNSYMSESRCAIARLNQSRPSAEARGERSCRVGDRGAKSPMHMSAGIAISRYPISRRSYGS